MSGLHDQTAGDFEVDSFVWPANDVTNIQRPLAEASRPDALGGGSEASAPGSSKPLGLSAGRLWTGDAAGRMALPCPVGAAVATRIPSAPTAGMLATDGPQLSSSAALALRESCLPEVTALPGDGSKIHWYGYLLPHFGTPVKDHPALHPPC